MLEFKCTNIFICRFINFVSKYKKYKNLGGQNYGSKQEENHIPDSHVNPSG